MEELLKAIKDLDSRIRYIEKVLLDFNLISPSDSIEILGKLPTRQTAKQIELQAMEDKK
jgi:hypothetical protein